MDKLKSSNYLIKISVLIVLIWSTVMLLAAIWNAQLQQKLTKQIVTSVARSNFDKDLAYRKWAASHGGVYVVPTEKTPPNPYLAHIEDRDVVTTNGKELTLMNPAYMLREMMDDYSEDSGIKGRITGILYLNPNNKADEWETKAIKEFQKGKKELVEVTIDEDEEYLRLMKPMIMKQECQMCHGHLGFENGSIRGGVSVSVPMKEYREHETQVINFIKWTAIVVWSVGLFFIVAITMYILKQLKQREKDLDELIVSHQILDNMLDSMFVTDINGTILRINNAFESSTGFSRKEVIGNKPSILKSHYHDDAFYKSLWENLIKNGQYTCEIFNRKKNGEIFVSIQNITSVRDKRGKIKYFISILHDITSRKDAEKRITHMAHYDPLTDLPNRVLFEIRFDHALELAKRNKSKIVLAYIDIDGFKNVNDTLGHPVGDKLLQNIALILNSSTRQSDTVSRLGGDEFAIILENVKNIDEITPMIDKILKLLKKNITIDKQPINISGSIGISIYPDNGNDIDTLVKCADIAMYRCKNNGKNNFCFFDK